MNEHSFMPVAMARRGRLSGGADKRDALLRAAIDTFAARGFFNAQVADVARAAGVAAGTVYLYYRGKDDLLISIFEKTMTEAIAEGRQSVSQLPNPAARLREIVRLHLDRLGRDRALAIVFQVELRQSTKFMERFSATQLREYLGIIRDVIADGQAAGAFRNDVNPTLAAKLLFGMLDEMATNWILSKRRYSLVSETDAIVGLFVGGLGPRTNTEGHGQGPRTNTEGHGPPPRTNTEGHGQGPRTNTDGHGPPPRTNTEGHGQGPRTNTDGHGPPPRTNTEGRGQGPRTNTDGHGPTPRTNTDGHGRTDTEGR